MQEAGEQEARSQAQSLQTCKTVCRVFSFSNFWLPQFQPSEQYEALLICASLFTVQKLFKPISYTSLICRRMEVGVVKTKSIGGKMSNRIYNQNVPEIDPTEIEDSRILPAQHHHSFLEKVMTQGKLADLYDARDITEVVFRTMRDMMTNEAVDHVSEELHSPLVEDNKDRTLYAATPLATEVEDLWEDTNPIVHFLSRVRPALQIRDTTFMFRIQQESGLPPQADVEQVVKAIFSATKDELSPERIEEIAGFLPGKVRELWQEA